MSGVSVERTDGTASVAAQGAPPRKIWLCADDYGISPSVSGAIRDLIGQGRINATSVMVVAPSFHRSEAAALNALRAHGARAAIGLHLTLSAPFRPLTEGFAPLADGAFPRYAHDAGARLPASARRRKALEAEIAAQIRMFEHEFGRAPDFIDGHQHVHIFPQVQDALFTVAREDGAGRLDQAVRPRRDRSRRGIGDPKGSRARSPEQALPRARGGEWRADQSRLRRNLCIQ